jgi:hypothetical protein
MGPVELLYFSIALIIMLIALARGYVEELGTTLIAMVAIFLLTFFEDQISSLVVTLTTRLFGYEEGLATDFLVSSFFTLVFVLIVFASYSGRSVTFSGQPAPQPTYLILSLIIGALNGYLIAGTLWYYQHAFTYPIQQFVEFDGQLTDTAESMVQYLPPNLFENPVYWMVPVAILLIIRIRG